MIDKRSWLPRQLRLSIFWLVGWTSLAPSEEVSYYGQIQPIVAKYCISCHSDQTKADLEVSAGLSLSNPEVLFAGDFPLVRANKLDASELYRRLISEDADERMPKDSPPLADNDVALVKQWIEHGAPLGKPMAVLSPEAESAQLPSRPRRLRPWRLATKAKLPAKTFGIEKPTTLEIGATIGPLAPVTAVAFSPDGKYLAWGSYQRLALFDCQTGLATVVSDAPTGMVHALAFSADGQSLWLAGGLPAQQGELAGYERESWRRFSQWRDTPDVLYALACSPKNDQLATVGFDRQLRLFQLPTGKLQHAVPAHSDVALVVNYSADGTFVVTGGKDTVVKWWESATAKSVSSFTGHNAAVLAAIVSPDGQQIYSSGSDSRLYIFDVQQGGKPNTSGAHNGTVYEFSWCADRSRFISGGSDAQVKIWRADGKQDRNLRGATDEVYSVALSPHADIAAAGCWDGLVRIWDTKSEKLILTLCLAEQPTGAAPDWLAVHEEGYFTCSDALLPRLQWHCGEHVLTATQMAPVLQQPQLITDLFRGQMPTSVTWPKP